MILRSSNGELARLHCLVVLLMSLNSSLPSASELSVHPSTCCRFCQKNVKCRGTAKIPRVSLFNEVFNKDLVGFSGADSLVLTDLASSLGHDLKSDPRFSDVSCLTCARTLARTHASVVKLFAGIVERGSLKAVKRQTNARSPTGDTPSAKRPNTSSGDRQESTSKSRRSLSLGGQTSGDDQSVLGVTPISDQLDSAMNIDGEQTIIKVS